MNIAYEIPGRGNWSNNPLTTEKWGEVPSPRFASAESALEWIESWKRDPTQPSRPLRIARVRPEGWGASDVGAWAVFAQQNR